MIQTQQNSTNYKTTMKKRIGDMNLVQNKGRKFGANESYYHVRVQLAGNVEKHLLFTEHQVNDALARAEKNEEDILKPGFIADITD